ncbi:VTT domain-containing protein [Crystallibacter degradans]|uniref:VTT domain-containing protein n=1 Tax=Crystallibacter degradans TaxID=2726743 RepID=UPI0014753464|nr:hypothetical protein [Arthrobacter sp. SF27]
MDIFLDLPLGWAILALFCVAMMRSNATYWLGRGIAAGGRHTRFERHLNGPVMKRAERFMNTFGPFAVTLCFLTVGIQTAVVSSAGIARMRMIRFLPAVVLGSLLWAIVYATVGMAAIAAWVALVLASPVAAVVIVVVLLGVLGCLIWRRKRGKRQSAKTERLTTAEPTEGASHPTFSAAPPGHTDRSE